MSNTIDLLGAIGQDASLRHASPEDLMSMLEQAKASDALKAAATSGESSYLTEELGYTSNVPPQVSNLPGHEEDEPDQDDPAKPDRDEPNKE